MNQAHQQVLVIDSNPEAIVEFLQEFIPPQIPPIIVVTAHDLGEAQSELDKNVFSLVIAAVGVDELSMAQFGDLAGQQAPRPIISMLSHSDNDQVLSLLRSGSSDVFMQTALNIDRPGLLAAILKLLQQSMLYEQHHQVQEELERSYAELRADQQAALQIQQNMLPPEHMQLADLEARYLLIPSLYLSGDFVDFVEIDGHRSMFYLADVSGHGASSALVTVLLKNMTHRLLRNFRRRSSFDIVSPLDTLRRINAEVLDTGLGKHLSIFLGLYDSRDCTLTYAVGGHHPMPILTDKTGSHFLEGRGMPVGLFDNPQFEQRKLVLSTPFQLTLFSDGILEVINAPDLAAKEQCLMQAVITAKGGSPEQLKQLLLPAILGETPDDIAIMTVARH
ncbi:SpoIIE family protein phosphatase [Neptuniibacter sp. CAU 1671]|uniref:PP2C family protein-serine/threonine phosphatase n=1 Tax=Neptuniibacter sp. CAU 1671 TaxID=3032593 RepID=UPI0023DBC181|nr:SpoIIE family protein phosphatase [Neptuniibacter sp. CAU 1671]MDF2181973.1 SpoIIE family protein phosphatase [Neptuniibacter sp. CAU 1671]